ncbi:MAG: DNA/RNA nuclease SfsA [Thermodesulfobacteriota bacterium]
MADKRILLPFPEGCVTGRLLRREKRFTVHVDLGGRQVAAHTNNSGSMLGLTRPGSEALLSPAPGAHRKLAWTLELVRLHGFWVGVNTATPNRILAAAHAAGLLPETRGYPGYRAERRAGDSRLDARLEGPDGRLWVEAKNVTMAEDGVALFPDAPTERGRKHLSELIALARQGERVACFFLVQRPDAACFGPAGVVDPDYAALFRRALAAGVEAWPYLATVSELGIGLGRRLPMAGRET